MSSIKRTHDMTSWNVAMLWWRDGVLVSRIEVKDGRN